MVLQPEHLWNLHLNTHLPPDIAEQIMTGGIDLLSFLNWSMIKPENNIPIISIIGETGASDWDWLIGIVGKDCKGTGCIEAYSADGGGIDVVLAESSLYAHADASPDVCG
jgi:hypothetical protein